MVKIEKDDDYNEEHLRIYKELEASVTAKSLLIKRFLHMFALMSVFMFYKIIELLLTVETTIDLDTSKS